MNGEYLAIAGRIHNELEELKRVVERTESIWGHARMSSDDYYVDATALNLQSFYTGIERLFELIADGVDQSKPSGMNWHQELLRQMTIEIKGVRPPVISLRLRDKLDKYRGFRHVVRNVYTYTLDPDLVKILVADLQSVYQGAQSELELFAGFLEQIAR